MPLTVGTNSWVTLAEADAYLATRYGASAWAGLSPAVRESLLITAYNWLRFQSNLSIPATCTADAVKNAQCEAAWYWYQHGEEWEQHANLYAGGVRNFSVMSWSEGLECPALPPLIGNLLTAYNSNGNFVPTLTRDY